MVRKSLFPYDLIMCFISDGQGVKLLLGTPL
jgi:hypothetical protein